MCNAISYETIIASLIGGGLSGAIVSHFLAKGRESVARQFAFAMTKEDRRGNFLGFMRAWRIEVIRTNPDWIAKGFTEKVSVFEGEVAKILAYYDRASVEELARQISSMSLTRIKEETGHKQPGKDELLGKMNAFIDFVTAN